MDPLLGQIMLVGFNFAPRGWALCHGQIFSIAQNTALFSLLGTQYGGNGQTTFAVPDLRGRVPMGFGTGPGLTPRTIGERSGTETNTLTTANLPSHNHSPTLRAESAIATSGNPTGNLLGLVTNVNARPYAPPGPADEVSMSSDAIISNNVGGNIPFNNVQPYLVVNYIIAIQGVFPSRN